VDPLDFLRRHPPFDRLTAAELARVGESLEIAYVPRGARLLSQGGEPAHHLYVVRKGTVRLERAGEALRELEEGECFGFPSLLARASPHADAVTAEDALLYQIPEATFARLVEGSQPFAQFFLLDLAGRLRQAAGAPIPLGRELATSVGRLPLAAPVAIGSGATVEEAAVRMRDARVSSLLVQSAPGGDAAEVAGTAEPTGILTDRDLRSRVLAAGRGPETPVAEVMSRPVATLASGASLFEALLFFLEHGVHHAPVEEGGAIVGMLTDTDLLRLAGKNPLAVLKGIERLVGPEGLAGYAREIAEMVEAQVAAGVEAAEVGRIVSRLSDALVRRLLRAAEAALGPPPCPYAWIVLGSEGRREQALLTDQDNALVYAEESAVAATYFAALAERGVAGLLAASFPPCPGGYMATNWHRPVAAWVELFRGVVARPEPAALVQAATFFDFRAVAGDLALDPLEEEVRRAGREGIFLAHLARAALGFTPPLGLLRHIRAEEGGVDLKRGGIAPIVALARVYALEAGSPARPTLERLAAAARAGTLSGEGAATLAEAFRFLLRLRLEGQLRALRAGEPPGNRVRLEELSPLERVHLKEVFLALREIQEATALRYSTARLS
jgi:CBS domain-containing protein